MRKRDPDLAVFTDTRIKAREHEKVAPRCSSQDLDGYAIRGTDGYYGYPHYWGGEGMWGTDPNPESMLTAASRAISC